MRSIILASQSPRRKELLTQMGVDFDVVPSNFNEKLDDSRAPEVVAMELALGKAMDVAQKYPDALVIGSDCIVTVHGRQLEKPVDEAEAYELLELLSGTNNTVSTGVAVVRLSDGTQLVGADSAEVYFKPYNEAAVKAYVSTGDPMDKAGAYGIQSGAAPLISHVEGRHDSIIGLPTKILAEYLQSLGITEAQAVDLRIEI
ncbi:Maf family protein [soil metagenome]